MQINQQMHLVSRPGLSGPSTDNFQLVEVPIADVAEHQVLLKTRYLSLDPYMRARMYEGDNYAQNAKLNAPMIGGTVSEIIISNHPDYAVGDIVESWHGWQSHHVCDAEGLRKINQGLGPISTALGVLGMPGLTGYGGMLRHGRPKPGETVIVSAASGAVGSMASQVAKIHQARVVGIAGGAKKCRFLTEELGLDAAVDHKSDDVAGEIAKACPNGIDVFFDNVGGDLFAKVLPHLNAGARIAICGTIGVDRNQTGKSDADSMQLLLSTTLIKQLSITGFLFTQLSDLTDEFQRDVSGWIKSGELVYREHQVDGLVNAPEAFLGLFKGLNFGKLLVKL